MAVIIGILAPFLVMLAVGLTLVTGPLAFILAPVAGVLLSRIIGAYTLQRVGWRWFWLYVGVAVVTLCAMIIPEILPRRSAGSATLEGALAGMYAGLGILLLAGCAVLWAIGTLAVILRNRDPGTSQ